ncbi:hypothetical protein BV25DRAFT_1920089 [Artomyces pyxidatus]|uniref:Uncharacterized protein n=1 Tax=Artomyces pyxidatus TaxID=48021 RepID=A0ACB8SMP7_9AGAM|nr:hypothetical protein BV25DRAFT_1920089 [Artomyces pyxidatus]
MSDQSSSRSASPPARAGQPATEQYHSTSTSNPELGAVMGENSHVSSKATNVSFKSSRLPGSSKTSHSQSISPGVPSDPSGGTSKRSSRRSNPSGSNQSSSSTKGVRPSSSNAQPRSTKIHLKREAPSSKPSSRLSKVSGGSLKPPGATSKSPVISSQNPELGDPSAGGSSDPLDPDLQSNAMGGGPSISNAKTSDAGGRTADADFQSKSSAGSSTASGGPLKTPRGDFETPEGSSAGGSSNSTDGPSNHPDSGLGSSRPTGAGPSSSKGQHPNPSSQPVHQSSTAMILEMAQKNFSDLQRTLAMNDASQKKAIADIRREIALSRQQPGKASANDEAKEAKGSSEPSTIKKKRGRVDRIDPHKDHPMHSAFLVCALLRLHILVILNVGDTIQDVIKTHLLYLLKIKTLDKLDSVAPPLTGTEIEAFETDEEGCIVIDGLNFRYDFEQKRNSLFNREAMTVFAKNLLHLMKDEGFYADRQIPAVFLDAHFIELCLFKHLKYAKARYNEIKKDRSQDEKDVSLRANAHNNRKYMKHTNRYDAMCKDPKLRKHSEAYKKAGTACVSSDETDTDPEYTEPGHKSYRRRSPLWRSIEATNLNWQAEAAVNASRTPKVGTRARPGSDPRVRRHTSLVNPQAPAPPGLERNWYNPVWTETLRPREIRLLKVQDCDYPFDESDFDGDTDGEEVEDEAGDIMNVD